MVRDYRDALPAGNGTVRIRLTKKLAESIDGIDLEQRRVGDIFEVSESEGRVLVAEQWAAWEDPPAETEQLSAKATLPAKPL